VVWKSVEVLILTCLPPLQQQIEGQDDSRVKFPTTDANSWQKNLVYSAESVVQTQRFTSGAVAQLIERIVRNDEVAGLIPVCSTNFV
jgi:hypothetical protein